MHTRTHACSHTCVHAHTPPAEPGFERTMHSETGRAQSRAYNKVRPCSLEAGSDARRWGLSRAVTHVVGAGGCRITQRARSSRAASREAVGYRGAPAVVGAAGQPGRGRGRGSCLLARNSGVRTAGLPRRTRAASRASSRGPTATPPLCCSHKSPFATRLSTWLSRLPAHLPPHTNPHTHIHASNPSPYVRRPSSWPC